MTESRLKAIAEALKPAPREYMHSFSEIKRLLIWKEFVGAITALIDHGNRLNVDPSISAKASWMFQKISGDKFVFTIVIDYKTGNKNNRFGIFYDDPYHVEIHLFTGVKEPDNDIPTALEDAQYPEVCLAKMGLMYTETQPYESAESATVHMMETLQHTAEEHPELKGAIEVLWRIYRRIFEAGKMEDELFRMYTHTDLVVKSILTNTEIDDVVKEEE